LKDLLKFGQSVWLDYMRGMTSNPAIFEKAIVGSKDYSSILEGLKGRKDLDAKGKFEVIAIRDIQDATDLLRPVYDESKWSDGYVSLEVSPHLARDTQRTLDEARRLWQAVNRPNLMIKVPGTKEGIPAFEQLTSEGMNVNVTLLFAQEVYEQVAEAYIRGLEKFAASGGDLRRIASVASFFVSRIDNSVDAEAANRLKTDKDPATSEKPSPMPSWHISAT
jgi:transaldolase/glucose-6-phosphate isomerase